jgi:hypothetical protein
MSTLICPYKEQYLSSERLSFLMEKKPFLVINNKFKSNISSITVEINCAIKKMDLQTDKLAMNMIVCP